MSLSIIAQLRALTTLLSVLQLAALLGVKPGTIAAWKQRGRGPARIEIGNTVRFDPAVVADWLEAQTVAPAAPTAPAPLPAWLTRNKAQITGDSSC